MKFIHLLILLVACSSPSSHEVTIFEKLNKIWRDKSSEEKIILEFGNPSKKENGTLIYNFKGSKVPIMAFTIESDKALKSIFYIMPKDEFINSKKYLECERDEKFPTIISGHVHSEGHTGSCSKHFITFKFDSSMNSYQVFWSGQ